jgi:flagellar hook-associated protein 1
MSISSSLHNALSGLSVNARRIELVSSNVANATTKGYARREAEVAPAILGGRGDGVRFVGVQRILNQFLLDDLRLADGAVAGQDSRRAFMGTVSEMLGSPDEASSLTGRLTRLETALSEAAARPSSDTRLAAVSDAVKSISDFLNTASDQIQTERLRTESEITAQITSLNEKLHQVQELNRDIRSFSGSGHDTSALKDQRQRLIDDIATIVPVRELKREHDQVALMTTGGLQLLDGHAVTFEFTAVNTVTPDMSVALGGLFLPTVNGEPIAGGIPGPRLAGGSLEALFDVRDNIAVQAQGRLDAFARELIERFQTPAADATLTPGDPGLFTDGGGAFNPLDEVGLAQRLSINALADPAQGGALWRIRSGLGAATANEAGNATILQALSGALTSASTPSSSVFGPASRRLADLATEVVSRQSGQLATQETTLSYTQARAESLRGRFLADGVDTDQEMQKLLQIEQAYAANAKVMSTCDELIQQLMAI